MEKALITNSRNRIDQIKGGTLMNKHIVQLIRERFYPLVRFCGPQSAGEVEIEGVRATVYLGELSIWLWPAKSSHNGVLSDEQLGDVVSPHLLVRNLLLSTQMSMQCLSSHLDRIEAGRRRHRLTTALLPRRFRCNGSRWDGSGTDTRSTNRRDSAMNCYIHPFHPATPAPTCQSCGPGQASSIAQGIGIRI